MNCKDLSLTFRQFNCKNFLTRIFYPLFNCKENLTHLFCDTLRCNFNILEGFQNQAMQA